MLKAKKNADGWMVEDTDGGVWVPNDEAAAEIEAADDNAAAKAVEICENEPMRGAWKQ